MGKIYTHNNKIITLNDVWLEEYVEPVDPWNPLNLPANTVRVRTRDGNAPTNANATYETATLVTGTTDTYDVYKSGTDFSSLLYKANNVVEILGANTTGITNMSQMFRACTSLTSSIPLFDTSNATNMNYMFTSCTYVETGALALYQQVSTQANPPSLHSLTFYQCGKNTQTGAAELAQIPSSWGGTGA